MKSVGRLMLMGVARSAASVGAFRDGRVPSWALAKLVNRLAAYMDWVRGEVKRGMRRPKHDAD